MIEHRVVGGPDDKRNVLVKATGDRKELEAFASQLASAGQEYEWEGDDLLWWGRMQQHLHPPWTGRIGS